MLRYLANGRSNKEIADELALSDRTVSTYKARLQQKLNVDSLAQLLEIAWRQGMLAGIAPQTATGQAVAADLEHAQFHRMFDAMPIPVALRDREGRVLACNRRHLEFHDITQEQAVGMRVFESRVLEPEQALQLHQGYLQSVALAEPYSVEHVLRYREQRIAVRSWGVPVRDTLGELIGMLCSSVDVTEQDREISALTQAREQDKSVRRTRSQFLHDSGEQLIGLLKACLTSMRSLTTQLPANPTLQMAQAQLQSLHDQLQMLLDLVRIERGSLVLLPSAADLALLTVEEVSRFNARQSTAEPCILMQTQATPTFGWVDTRRYRQMLRALCDYALYLGLEDIALRWQVTEQSHAEFLWQLIVEPGPRALVADRLHELNHYELNPHKVFCAQLATLMDGELVLEAPVAGAPLARLCVRLAHALAPANAAVSNRPFSA
ncbi:Bacterial regulatory protein, luxR family [compost metagenome]